MQENNAICGRFSASVKVLLAANISAIGPTKSVRVSRCVFVYKCCCLFQISPLTYIASF